MVRKTALPLLGMLGCVQPDPGDPDTGLPPLEWEGERVVLGTDLVDEVCAGTLAYLDATVESIEIELDLEPTSEKIPVFVLDSEVLETFCSPLVEACFNEGNLYTSPEGFSNARHELVHARLDQLGILGKRFFDEGIAAALDQNGGCLATPECAAADLDALLSATKSSDLYETRYTPGADLVHGLLVAHGPAKVLAFMDELERDTAPDEVRSIYLEHFGSVLDEDFQAFMRGPYDDFTVAQLTVGQLVATQRGCDSLIPASLDGAAGMELQGIMDCSSPNVINDFKNPTKGEIRWALNVPGEASGMFSRSFAPTEVNFDLQGCYPPPFDPLQLYDSGPYPHSWPDSSNHSSLILGPGLYALRWRADWGSTFSFNLAPSCVFESSVCPNEEQCTIWNECVPQIESPLPLGAACEQMPGAPLVCEAGSRCLGGSCVRECDATRECDEGDACARIRVCGPACDLLAQDCAAGFSCLPTGDDNELNDLGMGACVATGDAAYLDSCDLQGSECAAGLTCELIIPPPLWAPCAIAEGGCCVPFCDATVVQPDCPEDTPTCDPLRDGPVGTCWEK